MQHSRSVKKWEFISLLISDNDEKRAGVKINFIIKRIEVTRKKLLDERQRSAINFRFLDKKLKQKN